MTCVRCSNKSSLDFITFTYCSCYLYVVYSYYGNEIAVSSGSSSIFIVTYRRHEIFINRLRR